MKRGHPSDREVYLNAFRIKLRRVNISICVTDEDGTQHKLKGFSLTLKKHFQAKCEYFFGKNENESDHRTV